MKQDAYDVLYGTGSPNLVTVRTRPCRHCGAAKPENEWCPCENAQSLRRECESYDAPDGEPVRWMLAEARGAGLGILGVLVIVAVVVVSVVRCSSRAAWAAVAKPRAFVLHFPLALPPRRRFVRCAR